MVDFSAHTAWNAQYVLRIMYHDISVSRSELVLLTEYLPMSTSTGTSTVDSFIPVKASASNTCLKWITSNSYVLDDQGQTQSGAPVTNMD